MRVGDFSKLLYNNGIKIGRNNLYRWLQVNKYICKVYGHFSPKQQYLDNGYLPMWHKVLIDDDYEDCE